MFCLKFSSIVVLPPLVTSLMESEVAVEIRMPPTCAMAFSMASMVALDGSPPLPVAMTSRITICWACAAMHKTVPRQQASRRRRPKESSKLT